MANLALYCSIKISTMAKTMKSSQAGGVDEYIAGFPKNVQKQLQVLRATIRKAVPGVEEAIKYGIPTFVLKGNLVSFGAWKDHIGFYPAPREVEGFKKALSAYEGAKSTAKFPLDKPLPVSLISKMVKFNAKRNQEKAKAKMKKKS
jgi:uncharacterized protein YdhG (YjbR/CyaY superfamily)